jgi:hypothetical protein
MFSVTHSFTSIPQALSGLSLLQYFGNLLVLVEIAIPPVGSLHFLMYKIETVLPALMGCCVYEMR